VCLPRNGVNRSHVESQSLAAPVAFPVVCLSMRNLTTKQFSTRAIDAAKNGDSIREELSPGLRLHVGKTTKTWVYRYGTGSGGKQMKQVVLGHYPAMSIADARTAWSLARSRRADRLDPVPAHTAPASPTVVTVKMLTDAYLVEHVDIKRTEKASGEARRLFLRFVDPMVGARDASTFRVPDAVRFLTAVRKQTLATARVLRGEMRAAWRHALERGVVSGSNPFTDVMKGLLPQLKRTRVLSDAELAKLLKWMSGTGCPWTQDIRDAVLMTLFTACRSGEIVALEWLRVDLKRSSFTLEKTKTGVPRTVLYPSEVAKILKRRKASVSGKFVFPSVLEGRHIRQHALVWAISTSAKQCPVKDWSAHDLRRTARTGLARLGVSDDVAEAALGHSRGGVRGVYDLHARTDEVGTALAKWQKYVLSFGAT